LAEAGVASADKRTTADTKMILILIFSVNSLIFSANNVSTLGPRRRSRRRSRCRVWQGRVRRNNTDLLRKVPAAAVLSSPNGGVEISGRLAEGVSADKSE
jgi:hypothetical protein